MQKGAQVACDITFTILLLLFLLLLQFGKLIIAINPEVRVIGVEKGGNERGDRCERLNPPDMCVGVTICIKPEISISLKCISLIVIHILISPLYLFSILCLEWVIRPLRCFLSLQMGAVDFA